MASIINASTSGVGGVITTADNTGDLNIQSGGTTIVAITSSGAAITGAVTSSALTSGRITYATTGGELIDNANMTFDGNSIGLAGGNYDTGTDIDGNSKFGRTDRAYMQINRIGSASGSSIGFYTTPNASGALAERMRIDSAGNVGIGTTSTAQRLSLSIAGSAGATNFGLGNDTDASGAVIQYLGSTFATTTRREALEFYMTGANTKQIFYTNGTERMRIDSAGALILAGSTAQKATGTTWSNPSDIRLKDNVTNYTKGLAELMQVNVKEWEYNGKGGTTEGMKGLGVIADEVMEVLPNTVGTYQAKLNADDEDDTDIKKFDATEITWLMLNSIKEQQAMIDELKAEIELLKGVK
jgi:hypothetical protein